MRLFPRLFLTFAFVTAVSTVPLGLAVRHSVHASESKRFDDDVSSACEAIKSEVRGRGEGDYRLVSAACQSDELVDRTLTWIENGQIDSQRVSIGAKLVPSTRTAFDLNELMLVTGDGEVLGADPRELLSKSAREVEAVLNPGPTRYVLRTQPPLALVSRCRLTHNGHTAGIIGARYLVPLLARFASQFGVSVAVGSTAMPSSQSAQATCKLSDGAGSAVDIVVTKRKDALYKTLAEF